MMASTHPEKGDQYEEVSFRSNLGNESSEILAIQLGNAQTRAVYHLPYFSLCLDKCLYRVKQILKIRPKSPVTLTNHFRELSKLGCYLVTH